MTPNTPRRPPLSGTQLVWALVGIVFATAVLPPAAAWWLNTFRVAQTNARVAAAIDRLKSGDARTPTVGVVCGPGRLPGPQPGGRVAVSGSTHADWLNAAKRAPEVFGAGMPTDAWGRCFLMNETWLLSAGPNGWLETSPDSLALSGDDIGARLR